MAAGGHEVLNCRWLRRLFEGVARGVKPSSLDADVWGCRDSRRPMLLLQRLPGNTMDNMAAGPAIAAEATRLWGNACLYCTNGLRSSLAGLIATVRGRHCWHCSWGGSGRHALDQCEICCLLRDLLPVAMAPDLTLPRALLAPALSSCRRTVRPWTRR
jgi:hypothetical protein